MLPPPASGGVGTAVCIHPSTSLLVGLFLPAAAAVVQWLLWSAIEPFVWFMFLPTVFLCARLGGYVGGLIGTAVSAPLVWYVFLSPPFSWAADAPSELRSVALFALLGCLISEYEARVERSRRETVRALEDAREAAERALHLEAQHRRSNEQVRENETVLREAQRIARIGHWTWDFRADRPVWSEQMYRLFGRDPARSPANFKEVHRYYTPESWERISAAVDKAIRDGVPYELDTEIVREDGTRAWMTDRGEPVWGADGSIVALRGMLQDITERKRSEAHLNALRAEMEQMLTLHVASETAAAIAHELNQPLNAIAAYTEAAERMLRAGNPRPERLLHALESSSRQAQRAGEVMHELLVFLRKGDCASEPVDLDDAVRQALAIVEANRFGGFQTTVELAPGLRPVLANRLQLEKVLVNLVRNSIDAMSDAGMAPDRMAIRVSGVADGERAHLTVRDNGPGLSGEAARCAFQPFFTTKPKGTGLGLVISRSLIEAHGGRLWVDPPDGSGAIFHITLPFMP
ncbi:MAG TPA: ATP-binding protein [Rhodocyclaceae bacterium]|nr:ATP-binding protein [Rhodocyclaceae bacterium]